MPSYSAEKIRATYKANYERLVGIKKSTTRRTSFAAIRTSFGRRDRPIVVYSVEKLRITIIRKFKRIFQSPGAQVKDQLCRSELRQAGFSCDFYYPLVTTVRNDAQIANEIAALCKTEFFNRIGRFPTFANISIRSSERLLTMRADIRP